VKHIFNKNILISAIYLLICIAFTLVYNDPSLRIQHELIDKLNKFYEYIMNNPQDLESYITILAIILGGYWTYMLFIKKRQKYPRADMLHDIKHVPLSDKKTLLTLNVKIINIGDVMISIESGEVRVQQVLPVPEEILEEIQKGEDPVKENEREIFWSIINERKCKLEKDEVEIEPGESDNIKFDFIIDSDIMVIEIYSHFKNIKKQKRDLGWSLTSIYDLRS